MRVTTKGGNIKERKENDVVWACHARRGELCRKECDDYVCTTREEERKT